MMSKMAARILTYELESPSYGDSKLEKRKKVKKTIVQQSLSLFYGKRIWRTMVPFSAELMVSKMIVKFFS